MSTSHDDLRFTEDHEWLRLEGDGVVVIGITEHAQSALGDLVYVQMPAVGTHLKAGEELAVIESVKAAGDIKAPLAGTVTEVNDALASDPSLANTEPMQGGWIVKFKLDDPSALASLLTADAYTNLIEKP